MKSKNPCEYDPDGIPSLGIWKKFKENRFLAKLAWMADPPDPVIVFKKKRSRIPELLRSLDASQRSLNVGSGDTKYSDNMINLDLYPLENVRVVGFSDFLPFKDECFDLVVCQAVIEHVENPAQSVREIRRVLKKDGLLYAEIPFFQGFHASPTDFQRYTISGIQSLFREFILLEKGVLAGPSSALTWTLREFLAILFSFNNLYLYRFFNIFFGWLTLPLKYLDFFLEKSKFAPVIASGFFFLGKK